MAEIKTKPDNTRFITSRDGTELYINTDNIAGASLADIYTGELKKALLADNHEREPGLRKLKKRLQTEFSHTSDNFETPTRLRPSAYGDPGSQAFVIASHVNEVIDAHRDWDAEQKDAISVVEP